MIKNLKHIIWWCLYGSFLFVIFNLVTDSSTASIRTLTIVFTQMIVFYLNVKWILPSFYETKKYIHFAIVNMLLLIASIFFSEYITRLTPLYKSMDNEENDYNSTNNFEIFDLEIIFTYAMPITLIVFISFFLYTSQRRKEQEEKELAIVTAEKNFLVQQINPHFLFNTLNNIYFLTYKTSPKGSEAIMQLSKMLDYSLYGEKEGNVSVKDEITYVNNFIALYRLKDSEIKNIQFDYDDVNTHLKIVPMLLIPFVENAFKHGNIENEGHIHIKLSTHKNTIDFSCKNSFVLKKNTDKTGGIGIVNVTRRLELLYPNKHKLKIDKNDNEYSVSLKLETNV